MKLSDTNQKIIDAIISKAKKVCPGSLALIGIYGSVCTGDVHEKSDLDLMLLIHDDAGWRLSDSFILDDKKIGYDIYCTTWRMLEEEASCKHARLAKLMDSKIVYVADDAAIQRISEMKARAENILKSEKRFECVDRIIHEAKGIYADAMVAETIGEVRMYAACSINLLLDAVMLENGKYFQKGVKRTFEELEGSSLPKHFVDTIYSIAMASEMAELKRNLTDLLRSAAAFVKRIKDKEQPSEGNISGTYEEMFSNWRNKMTEAIEKNDVFSSFMNLASLQLMADEIANDIAIEPFNVMDNYNPVDLEKNVEVFDDALNKYLQEYQRIGIQSKHFANVEEFVESYLQE